MMRTAILDANVVLSGLKSKNGSPFRLLQALEDERFEIAISVPLVLEYESVLFNHLDRAIFTDEDIRDFIDYLCRIGRPTQIYYLWRPILKDPFDDHVLEVAVASESPYIVSYNKKDFKAAKSFGIEIVSPFEFLKTLGGNT